MIHFNEIAAAYESDLRGYVANPTEEGLAAAYENGRSALTGGIGLVAFAEMHWRAFAEVAAETYQGVEGNLAATFFAEAMAPYEMALRAFRDTNLVLNRANQQLSRANLMKTRFFNYLNHELRTPLNSVLGFAELIHAGKVGPLTDPQRRYSANIVTAGRQMLHLVNEMLDLAKLEAGKMEVSKEEVDLTAVILAAMEETAPLAGRAGIEVSFESEPRHFATGDRQRLLQVFLNLISNAVKFTGPGGRVSIEVASSPSEVMVAVIDTGIGIPVDKLEEIFDEFAQAEMAESAEPLGTGLGLPLTRRLLDLMGGSVVARSAPGAGSTFEIHLPGWQAAGLDRARPRPELAMTAG
jgi:signal transduction histidine kinase